MTDRYEIEYLLNQTGRTLEGIPKEHNMAERIDAMNRPGEWCETICHQSDVIELLVGALRDALGKTKQKPLTLEEVKDAGIVFIEYQYTKELRTAFVVKRGNNRDFNVIAAKGSSTLRDCTLTQMSNSLFGKIWRAWASRPTDEERSAAEWEV